MRIYKTGKYLSVSKHVKNLSKLNQMNRVYKILQTAVSVLIERQLKINKLFLTN